MKKLFLTLVLVFASAQSFAMGYLYDVIIEQVSPNNSPAVIGKSFSVGTVVGQEARYDQTTQNYRANEVNTQDGAVETVLNKSVVGIRSAITPVSVDSAGTVKTVLTYELTDNGGIISKGTHRFDIAPNHTVKLPGANGVGLIITLKPNQPK
jgi:hypothetical protein